MSFYRDEQFDKLSEIWANTIIARERGAAKAKDVSEAFNAITDYLDARFQSAAQPVVLSDEQIKDLKDAISETEYKYFGCYEFTEKQHTAVDVLVEVARMVIAAKEQA